MAVELKNFPEASARWLQQLYDMMQQQRREFRNRESNWRAEKAAMEDMVQTLQWNNSQVH